MVGLGGFEPPTSPLSGVRSNQLSYRPNSFEQIDSLCPLASFVCLPFLLLPLQDLAFPRLRCKPLDSFYAYPSWVSLDQNNLLWVLIIALKLLCKEVIQPQVPLGLPCYDFTPVMNHKVVTGLPKVSLATSFATHSHGVTGGVYKARERIHRDILIRDY